MSYDHAALFGRLIALIEERPGLTLARHCAQLSVNRHTIRTVLAERGQDFASLQQAAVRRLINRHLASGGPWKLAWTRAGFKSGAAFARYVRRLTGKSPSELRPSGALAQKDHNWPEKDLDLLGGDGPRSGLGRLDVTAKRRATMSDKSKEAPKPQPLVLTPTLHGMVCQQDEPLGCGCSAYYGDGSGNCCDCGSLNGQGH